MSDRNNQTFKSLTQLNEEIESVAGVVRYKNTSQICSSAIKLLEEAKKYQNNNDYDNAYILVGRYLNLFTQMQKKPDYHQQKNYIKSTLGGNETQQRVLKQMEQLQNLILKRNKDQKIHQKKEEECVPEPLPVEIKIPEKALTEVRQTITSQALNEMIEKDSSKLLIFDCRSNEDYQISRISFKFVCNVPEKICSIGSTPSKIQNQLPNDSQVFWQMRINRPTIVFIDWFSKSFLRNTPVWHLKNILLEWDQDTEKKPEIILLEGGYENWLLTYPMKCSDPHIKVPRSADNSIPQIDDIEYPNIEDIVMKDQSINVPHFDRSKKNDAVKSYEKVLSQAQLLEEKEKILDTSLRNEQEMLKLEDEIQNVTMNKENEEDFSNDQQKLFKLWELRSKQEDVQREQDKIDQKLEFVKKNTIYEQPMTKVKDLEMRLEEKKNEDLKYKLEREKKAKEMEESLRAVRKIKKPFEEHKSPIKAPRRNELILSPKALNSNVIPHFDRTSKPNHHINTQNFYDNQDFAPVYQKVERGLTGLKNLGNTCYMNSIIQCLSHTLALTQYVLENVYEKQINRSNNTKGHIVRTLAAVIKMLWSGECKYISSKHLKAVTGEQEHLFYGMDQQDAHEFLIMLIDWLQSDLQTISMQNIIEPTLPASEKAWLEYTKAKESFILRLFYGQIKSTVKCTQCHEESATFETFSNLSLELPMINIDQCHITDCFDSYFNGEKIYGWNCPRCKAPREAVKKLDISKLPPVLIIHLKRFYADPYGSFRKKTCYVNFPLTDLDMISFVAPKERINIASSHHSYHLYAVSNHYGSMESGHYTAFCRNAKQNKWYKFDDHNVTQTDRSDVKSSAAYILFYTYLQESHYMNMIMN